MKCEWVKDNIVLYVYNELADDARYELEQHLGRCPGCATELKATRRFHATLSVTPVDEPTPNLLTASRMRLQEALETTSQGGFWNRLVFDPGAWLRQVRFSPALAAAIFIVGFGGGIGATYKVIAKPGDAAILVRFRHGGTAGWGSEYHGYQFVTTVPGSNEVTIKYNTVSTQEQKGSLSDQRIQQLAAFCGAQQLQLRSADGFGRSADAEAGRHACAGSADVCAAL